MSGEAHVKIVGVDLGWDKEYQQRLDMFAAAALTGLLAHGLIRPTWGELADDAWAYARAMLDNEPKE